MHSFESLTIIRWLRSKVEILVDYIVIMPAERSSQAVDYRTGISSVKEGGS